MIDQFKQIPIQHKLELLELMENRKNKKSNTSRNDEENETQRTTSAKPVAIKSGK